jgi:hypothetical protein
MKSKINYEFVNPKVWEIINTYPDSLKAKFETLREGLHSYVNDGYSTALFKKYHFNNHFWKSFFRRISYNQALELSFRKAGGLKSYIGFEWCKYKIKLFYRKYRKVPPYTREKKRRIVLNIYNLSPINQI